MTQSLYRRYRPQRFDDRFVGQEHVRDALRHAVRDGSVGHAYLFSGPRGTGKTTTARLLAKALNCLDPGDEGDPCGVCDNCVSIAAGRFLDLFELDAASNNSVDNIRDLTESVHLGLGPSSRMKVYIIDEVHMLSGAASNALLKTLEEPPDHVVFVLATTNPEKVLPTIRSRTQHFEFTLLETGQLADHLRDIATAENVDVSDEVIAHVARSGAGSVRDSLSLLDQVLALGAGGTLDVASLEGLLGGTGFDARIAILDAIAEEDPAGALVELQTLTDAGHDPRRVGEDVLRTARDGFLLQAGGGRVRLEMPDDERERLVALGTTLGNAGLVKVIETLGTAIVDMRGRDAADPRLLLEVALVRLARSDAGPPLEALAKRVERLEQDRTTGTGPSPRTRSDADAAGSSAPEAASGGPKALGALRRQRERQGAPPTTSTSEPEAAPSDDAAHANDAAHDEAGPTDAVTAPGNTSTGEPLSADTGPLDVDDVIVAWADLLPALSPATRSAVQEAQPIRVDGNVVVFAISPDLVQMAKPRFKKVADQIRDGLGERLGRTLKFTLVAEEPLASASVGSTEDSSAESSAKVSVDVTDEPEEAVDLDELVDADPDGAAVDSVGRLQEAFGAQVVEERPRES